MSGIDGVYAKLQTKVVEDRPSPIGKLAVLAGEWKGVRPVFPIKGRSVEFRTTFFEPMAP
ncbi:hypothetical protein GAY31_09400 [Azospirillum brasilense]|nr:hypothetical protein [Azospirillum brasilense]